MNSPELLILTLNAIVVLLAYFVIYPKYCGANGNLIAVNDLIASAIVLVIAGSLFWGSNTEFNLILFSANWFWFTFITYGLIEVPFMLWYFRKHDVWSSFKF